MDRAARRAKSSMTSIAAIADLHGRFDVELPEADVLLIAGDVCPVTDHGVEFQAEWLERELYPWLEKLPHPEIAWIAGNHDFVCELEDWRPAGRGVHLRDSEVELAGLRIYGTPWIPTLQGWAFYATDEELATRCAAIPEGVDVVLAHGPPHGYGDRTVHGNDAGSRQLLARIEEVEPRLCVFGHIHEDHGRWELGPTVLANVAAVDELYAPRAGAAVRFEL
jgi:Icc-related predicted phosphoesterase